MKNCKQSSWIMFWLYLFFNFWLRYKENPFLTKISSGSKLNLMRLIYFLNRWGWVPWHIIFQTVLYEWALACILYVNNCVHYKSSSGIRYWLYFTCSLIYGYVIKKCLFFPKISSGSKLNLLRLIYFLNR